jgi:hypothetical protein
MKATDLRLGNTIGMLLDDSTAIKVTVDIYHLSCILNKSRKYFPIPITTDELKKLRDNMYDEHTGTSIMNEYDVEEGRWIFGTASYYVFELKEHEGMKWVNPDDSPLWKVIAFKPFKKVTSLLEEETLYARIAYIHELQNIFHALSESREEIQYKKV